jgi:hypothetical protein
MSHANAAASAPSSLFRRLMLGFSGVIVIVFLLGLAYVLQDARITQRTRTAAENRAHAREAMLHLALLAGRPRELVAAARELEAVRRACSTPSTTTRRCACASGARRLLYDSLPGLPDTLKTPDQVRLLRENGWVTSVESDPATGLALERSHEVDDLWMLSMSGISFLASSTVFSLPLLLLPAWLIVGIGLRPLREIAAAIEQRAVSDLTALPASKYRELSPLVDAINRLMKRLSERIEREHQFLTDAAHELKTPLVAVQINAHVLLSRCDAGHPRALADAADGLRDGVDRATRMVHQLLALERTQPKPARRRCRRWNWAPWCATAWPPPSRWPCSAASRSSSRPTPNAICRCTWRASRPWSTTWSAMRSSIRRKAAPSTSSWRRRRRLPPEHRRPGPGIDPGIAGFPGAALENRERGTGLQGVRALLPDSGPGPAGQRAGTGDRRARGGRHRTEIASLGSMTIDAVLELLSQRF